MAEYIERESVIDELDEWKELYQDSGAACDVLALAKRAVRKLPAADVRPVVRGTWDMYKDGSGVCSVCGKAQFQHWDDGKPDRFCHFCGTRMEEN